MTKWKERWNQLLPYEKCFDVMANLFLCVAVLGFMIEILQTVHVLAISDHIHPISRGFLALGLACEAVVFWRKNRSHAGLWIILACLFLVKAAVGLMP